jgi:hypothetical protein
MNSNSSTCDLCPPGSYSLIGSLTCTPCDAGTFSTLSGSTSCEPCSVPSFTRGSGNSVCSNCAPGSQKVQRFNATISDCQNCPAGKYSDQNSSCKSCPTGKWSDLIGASSDGVCRKCPSFDACLCPEGTSIPIVGAGLYRNLSSPGEVFTCLPSEACLAALYGNTSCATGYSGFRCLNCNLEYFRSGGRCVKCLTRAARWSIMAVSAVLAVIALAMFSRHQTQIPNTLRFIFFWFQFLAVYPTLSSAWPSTLFSFFRLTSIFNLDIGYLGLECDPWRIRSISSLL